MSAHQEFSARTSAPPRSRQWLVIGFGLAVVCVSGTALAAVPPTEPPATEPAPEPATAPTTTRTSPTTTAPSRSPRPPGPRRRPSTDAEPAPPAPVDIDIVPLCTSSEDMAAGTRTFRLDNHGSRAGRGDTAQRRHRRVGERHRGAGALDVGRAGRRRGQHDGGRRERAGRGDQRLDEPDVRRAPRPRRVQPVERDHDDHVDGEQQRRIAGHRAQRLRGVDFQPNPDAPHGASTGVEVVDGPASDDEITETVTIQLADGGTSRLTASVTAAACTGPSLTPDVSFTFTKTPSVPTAGVGDTVEYVYCGQNTGAIPLEVVRLVDDRLGVVIELPGVETVVGAGDSLCNTDIGQPVNYTVRLADSRDDHHQPRRRHRAHARGDTTRVPGDRDRHRRRRPVAAGAGPARRREDVGLPPHRGRSGEPVQLEQRLRLLDGCVGTHQPRGGHHPAGAVGSRAELRPGQWRRSG